MTDGMDPAYPTARSQAAGTVVFPRASGPRPVDQRSAPPDARRRGRRRRVLLILCLVVVACLLLGVVGLGYAALKLRSIGRVTVAGLHPVGSGSPQTILLTGSDSRAGETPAQAQHFGGATQVTGQRSDVIVLIHLDPVSGKAAMLSIPRDLFVPIAGTSSSNRINVAFDTSPSRLVATIQQDFAITVNHYAQEDFSGLQAVTDAVGGVCMAFPYPVRDGSPTGTGNESGLNIPTAGRHKLDGAMALALVRSRYYQYDVNGTWRAEGTGDIGRIQRQHSFMRALATKAIHASLRNPFTANAVLGKAVHHVTIDSSYTTLGLMRLGLHLRSMHPSAMASFTLPYTAANNYRGYGDVLLPDPSADAAVIAAWLNYGASTSTTPPVPPASITVRVLNGSGVSGQARTAADRLRSLGFSISAYATAPTTVRGASVVAYGPGMKRAAQTVAAHLAGPVSLRADGHAVTTVTVTTGTAFAGVIGSSSSSAAAAGTAGSGIPAPSALAPWDPTPC
jgi:LCP family protein required for cell wall assembly